MGKDSKISWTNHTFNPWWGCSEVPADPGCAHCYAREFAKRGGLAWGDKATRRMFGEAHWHEPLRWNKTVAKRGNRRERVFVGSMCDVFEDRPELDAVRARLWHLIAQCSNLEWLLLTKRPENAARMVPQAWSEGWPVNVWFGATASNKAILNARVPLVRAIPAAVRFLSCEPLLEELDFDHGWFFGAHKIDWVIFGGESGSTARQCHSGWIEQAVRTLAGSGGTDHGWGVDVFVKQMGQNFTVFDHDVSAWLAHPATAVVGDGPLTRSGGLIAYTKRIKLGDLSGRDPEQWPEKLRLQMYPGVHLVRGAAEAALAAAELAP
jgi:protein gp37